MTSWRLIRSVYRRSCKRTCADGVIARQVSRRSCMQGGDERRGGWIALARLLGPSSWLSAASTLSGRSGPVEARRRRRFVHVLVEQGHHRIGFERNFAGNHQIGDHAQRIQVRAIVDVQTLDLLQGHVPGRADQYARRVNRLASSALAMPKSARLSGRAPQPACCWASHRGG